MRKLLIILLALLALAAIAYFCAYKTHMPAIQADIAARTKSALSDNGISSIDVNVDGRNITLTGHVDSQQNKREAERIAQVEGYNFISNQINVGDGIAQSGNGTRMQSLSVKLDESGKVTLDGILDANTHKALHEATIARFGKEKVEDRILELDIPMADGMPDVAIFMMEKMGALSSGEAMLIGKEIEVKGTSPSPAMISQLEEEFVTQSPDGYNVQLGLKVGQLASTTPKDTAKNAQAAKDKAAKAKLAKAKTDKKKEKPANLAMRKQCQRQFNSLLKSKKIRFNSSSAVLEKSSYRVLNKVARRANKCSGMIIVVHGHTDSTGRNKLNKKLSKKRARAVARYLAKKGVSKNKLVSVGHGSSKPIASNKTLKGRARNRRIELTVKRIK